MIPNAGDFKSPPPPGTRCEFGGILLLVQDAHAFEALGGNRCELCELCLADSKLLCQCVPCGFKSASGRSTENFIYYIRLPGGTEGL